MTETQFYQVLKYYLRESEKPSLFSADDLSAYNGIYFDNINKNNLINVINTKLEEISPNPVNVSTYKRFDNGFKRNFNGSNRKLMKQAPRAYDPTRKLNNDDLVLKKYRENLNKMVESNYEVVSKELLGIEIVNLYMMQRVIDLIYEKALIDIKYTYLYARLCSIYENEKKLKFVDEGNNVTFKKALIDRINKEIEKDYEEIISRINDNSEYNSNDKLIKIGRIKTMKVGNIRFLCELYKKNVIELQLVKDASGKLLDDLDDEKVECLCEMLKSLGRLLENSGDYMTKLMLSLENYDTKDIKTKFKIMDVKDLRDNKWIVKKDNEKNPWNNFSINKIKSPGFERKNIFSLKKRDVDYDTLIEEYMVNMTMNEINEELTKVKNYNKWWHTWFSIYFESKEDKHSKLFELKNILCKNRYMSKDFDKVRNMKMKSISDLEIDYPNVRKLINKIKNDN